ncbi:MAG: tRNA (N(6)-L-threonylcarbamoyladenosine(37)-C(2))-methylthiotransferase MtaB, partial [Anaerovoracaceae bacterium]
MKIAFHTLGCKVNQYETEAMKEQFTKRGHQLVGEDEFSDVYIINTCTVTGLADRKSRQYIRRMKKLNPDSIVAVTGCYVQVNPEEVASIQGVNLIAGTNEKHKLIEYIEHYHGDALCTHLNAYEELTTYEETGIITSMESRTRAYVKIQEGCDRFCAYCIIPYARGPVRSREKEEILKEVEALLEKGFKEIILTGINTALYPDLLGLLSAIEQLSGEFRIRLSSLEPTVVNKDYVKKLFAFPRLCHHLHLSLQSGSDRILEKMKRRYDREAYMEIVETLRAFDPHYGITTDIIVGFPGETEGDFEDSLDIVRRAEFCKVHGFKYSKRSGTPAADFPDQINGGIKKERNTRLMEEGEGVGKRFFEKNLG